MDTISRVRELVSLLVADQGATIYDLELAGGVLRLTLDHPEGVGISLITSVTRAVSRALDEEDPIAGEYTLEVSSPGLERPLRTPDHYASSIGDTVAVKTRPGVEGDRRFQGELIAADAEGFVVRTDADGERRLSFGDVERARTIFEWGPAPKPGGAKSGRTPSAPSTQKKATKS